MRRPRTLLLLLTLVALMASAGEQSTIYKSAPKPVKQVVQTQNRAKMLTPQKVSSLKKAPSASQFEGLTFYANLTNSEEWDGVGIGSVPYGVYSYTIGEDGAFQALATDLRYNFMAAAMGRDQLVGVRPMQLMGALTGVEYIGLSRDNFGELWSMVYDYADYSFIPSTMAYDVTSDIIYSVQYNNDLTGLNMARWNPISRMFETICAWPNHFQPMTLGFTPDGEMYCVGYDGGFYQLDKETGDARMLGTLDVAPTMYVQSMCYEPRNACFLWMAVTQEGCALYAIDPYDVTVTMVKKLDKNEQAAAVFFKDNAAPAQAPAAATDLAFTFDGGSTDGTISFTVPTTTYDGNALTGNVQMSVWLDGEPIANYVNVAPGSAQTFSQTVENDNHYVYVLFNNAGGFSPVNSLYVYAGYDTPLPVTNAVFTVEDGVSHLTWDAPAGGVNNGYLADVTYSVIRMPGSVMVAEGLTECEFSETLPSKMERYYYIIIPFNGDGKRGDEAVSNSVLTGTAFEAPYFDDFSDMGTRELWTIVNANNDASSWGTVYTWTFNDYNKCWGVNTGPYNMGDDQDGADDYLISPGINIEQGISYALIFNMRNTFANYKERVALMVGTDPNDVSTFQVLDFNESYDVNGTLADWEVDFQMEEAGTYYFAVHAYTKREDNASGLFVNSMALNKLGRNEAPAEVTNLTITPEETGEMLADITFTVPTTTLDGGELTAPLTANIYRDGSEEAVAQFPVEVGENALWTDNTVEGVGVHTYTVGISNDAGEGKRVSAEAFIGVYTAPYTNAFDTEEDARFFYTVNDSSIYSTNEYRWIWGGSYNQNLALGGYGYYVQHPVEMIWLYMPAIKLEKDMVYTYAFNWTYNNYNQTSPGFASIGMATDPEAQTVYPDQLPFTNYGQKIWIENEVIAGETGKYYPAILITADQQYAYISPSIDDISITLVGSSFAPYSVENLVAEHDMAGLLKVNFSFNAPTVDYAQRPLEGPLTVYIYREGSAIPLMTFENVEPGQSLEWVDEQPLRGINSYVIVAENEYGRGKPSTADVFAGVDVPLAVENFWIRGNEDNQKAVLTWDAPAGSVNGGVIDGSLIYTVVEYFPDGATPEEQMVIIGITTETTFIVDREPTDEMQMHYYAVIPSTSAGIGQAVLDDIILGKLKDIPYIETFENGVLATTGWMTEGDVANYGTVWYILEDNDEQTGQDGNGYALCYNGNYYSQYHWADLVSPKVKIDPEKLYTLSFYVYMGYASSSAILPTLVVSKSINDDPYEELITIDVTEGNGEWELFEIPLTGTEIANHLKVCFRGYMSTMSERIWLDNVRITAEDNPSGVNELAGKEQVAVVKGGVSIEGFEGQQVRVFTVDGRQVDAFVADGCRTVSMAPGIYIVTVGKQAFKVSVR